MGQGVEREATDLAGYSGLDWAIENQHRGVVLLFCNGDEAKTDLMMARKVKPMEKLEADELHYENKVFEGKLGARYEEAEAGILAASLLAASLAQPEEAEEDLENMASRWD
jgi:hypothetical protein